MNFFKNFFSFKNFWLRSILFGLPTRANVNCDTPKLCECFPKILSRKRNAKRVFGKKLQNLLFLHQTIKEKNRSSQRMFWKESYDITFKVFLNSFNFINQGKKEITSKPVKIKKSIHFLCPPLGVQEKGGSQTLEKNSTIGIQLDATLFCLGIFLFQVFFFLLFRNRQKSTCCVCFSLLRFLLWELWLPLSR